MFDFDNIDDWALEFAAALSQQVPDAVGATLAAEAPESVEDARNLLFALTDPEAVIHGALNLIRSKRASKK